MQGFLIISSISYALGLSSICDCTNLQISVNNPVDMAVMDALQDLLYAVADVTKRTEKETKTER